MGEQAFFHGGPRGLSAILPARLTGADSTSILTGTSGVHDPSKVYVTTSYEAAIMFAAGHPKGCVYEVRPEGAARDPDCSQDGLSFECERAAILRVHRIPGKQLKLARKALLSSEEPDHAR